MDGYVIAALIIAGLAYGIYRFAQSKDREQEAEAVQIAVERGPRRRSPEELLDGIEWWSTVWGAPLRADACAVYDQEADAPLERPAYVGAGRGHEL